MKPKSVEVFLHDFQKVREQNHTEYDTWGLSKFFDNGSEYNHNGIISTFGMRTLEDMIDYASSLLLPSNGSWIDYKVNDIEDLAAAERLRELLAYRLGESNFYDVLREVLIEGTIYKGGLLSSEYHGGLSFKKLAGRNIFLSRDNIVHNRRLYYYEEYSGADLRAMFTNLPDYFETPVDKIDTVATQWFTVIEGLVPINSTFFENPISSRNYVKVHILLDTMYGTILDHVDGPEYHKSIPVVQYDGGRGRNPSLAALCIPSLVKLERMEYGISEYTDGALNPPVAIDQGVVERGTMDLGAAGMVVLKANERGVEPIETSKNLPFTLEDLKLREQEIRDIFKSDLIDRAMYNNLTQFEVAANQLTTIRAIAPRFRGFLNRSLSYALDRIHGLLISNDKEYRDLAKSIDGKLMIRGVDIVEQNLEKKVDIARFAQGAVPFIQMDSNAVLRIDGDGIIQRLAHCYGLSSEMRTNNEVKGIMAAQAQQLQQRQELENEKISAETDKIIEEDGNE